VFDGSSTPITVTLQRSDGTALGSMPALEGAIVTFYMGTGGNFSPGSVGIDNNVASSTLAATTPGAQTARIKVTGTEIEFPIEVRTRTSTNVTPVRLGATPRFATAVTCDRGTWSPSLASFDFTYSWARDGVAIAGATSATYTPVAKDIGHLLRCTATSAGPFQDTTTGTSTAVKVLKRLTVLSLLQSKSTGVSLTCGTLAKPCVVRRGTAAFARLAPHASHPTAIKSAFVIEAKVGRRWRARPSVLLTFGAKAVAIPVRALGSGTYRFRMRYAGSATSMPAASAYRYFKVR
jgi:hypothetical protein